MCCRLVSSIYWILHLVTHSTHDIQHTLQPHIYNHILIRVGYFSTWLDNWQENPAETWGSSTQLPESTHIQKKINLSNILDLSSNHCWYLSVEIIGMFPPSFFLRKKRQRNTEHLFQLTKLYIISRKEMRYITIHQNFGWFWCNNSPRFWMILVGWLTPPNHPHFFRGRFKQLPGFSTWLQVKISCM